MSLILLVGFILAATGEMPMEYYTNDIFTIWALFSIADALWLRLLFKK